MGAVVMIIVTARIASRPENTDGAVHTAGHIQLRMLEVDAGVDDRHVHIHAIIVAAVDINLRVGIGKDALDAGGHGLGADAALHVFDHICHARVVLQRFQAPGWHDRRHAFQGMLVNETGCKP